MRILVIEPGKGPVEREIDGTLKTMQEIVGGPIQVMYPFGDTTVLICHEEGKLLGLPKCYGGYERKLEQDTPWRVLLACDRSLFLRAMVPDAKR